MSTVYAVAPLKSFDILALYKCDYYYYHYHYVHKKLFLNQV